MRLLRRRRLVAAVAAVLLMAVPSMAAAQSTNTVELGGNDELGEFLVAANGMTLYIFTPDEPGKSNCNGGCAVAWPPLAASGDLTLGPGVSGELSVITRDDGSDQVALDGQPLYFWQNDSAPGDATGQGVNDKWYVLDASGTPVLAAPAAAEEAAPETPVAGSAGNAGLFTPDGRSTLAVVVLLLGAVALVAAGRRATSSR